MKHRISVIVFLFIFTVSVSSAVAMACCWNMESDVQVAAHAMSEDMSEDCHSAADEEPTTSSDKTSKDDTSDCCYNMMECQVQLFKVANVFSINTQSFDINYGNKTDKFISNTIEPLKHPPKVLL